MAFTDTQVRRLKAKLEPQIRQNPQSQRGGAELCRGLACHCRGQSHLRLRRLEHRKFVASQPCIVCGRTPAQAHHVRFAQSRGVSLKVSDEFTVPLCALHHSGEPQDGRRRRWWHERNLDPLAATSELWRQSRDQCSSPNSSDVDGTAPERLLSGTEKSIMLLARGKRSCPRCLWGASAVGRS
jgi:hypothetical protein